ncbi:MAG: YdcF family protein [Tissierellia bacterium]|nr:YdcF family protein [Tissierellia bacterium]
MRSIKDINDYIFMEDKMEKSDLIILPGSLSFQTIELAAELYKRDLAALILASGAYSKDVGRFEWEKIKKEEYKRNFKTEFEYMNYALIQNGVPEDAIIKEGRAQYTYQNALYSREILEDMGIAFDKIILCVKDYHARRSFMYFDMVFPDSDILVAPAVIEIASRERWTESELGIRVITNELRKIGEQFYDIFIEEFLKYKR